MRKLSSKILISSLKASARPMALRRQSISRKIIAASFIFSMLLPTISFGQYLGRPGLINLLLQQQQGQQSQGRTLLDFTATWCGPCRSMKPVIEQLKKAGYKVEEVDIDQNRQKANQFKITDIPAFVVVENGKEINRVVGSTTIENLKSMLGKPSQSTGTGVGAQPTQTSKEEPTQSSNDNRPSLFALKDCAEHKDAKPPHYDCKDSLGRKFIVTEEGFAWMMKQRVGTTFVYYPDTKKMDIYKPSASSPTTITPPVNWPDNLSEIDSDEIPPGYLKFILRYAPADKFDIDLKFFEDSDNKVWIDGKICSKNVEPGYCVPIKMSWPDLKKNLSDLMKPPKPQPKITPTPRGLPDPKEAPKPPQTFR